ncbi:MAG: peptidoglycan DD-metalloendopeptidase family protein [Bacteroidetes bacterium]|nr:peptidoglycan DD-metalloendopeptidase family protein [Bacteroidota bacterium]
MDFKKRLRWLLVVSAFTIAIVIALMLLKDFIIMPIAKPIPSVPPKVEFGIVTDSFSIVRDEVKPGDNLSSVISNFNVEAGQLSLLTEKTRGIFDIRKFRAGNEYTAMISNKEDKKLQYFVYEVSDTSYVVFDFRDSLHVHFGSKEVVHRLRSVSGTINSSLWNTIEDIQANPDLAIALAEIYQWSIDFYAIQKGDEFKVIYEDISVNGKSVGVGIIHSACFKHLGQDYNAFRFEQNNTAEYFNEKGQNLRREFLKAPLKFTRISSRFSNNRFHPVLRIFRPHHGVDYAAPTGTPVHSIGNGTIVKAGYAGGAGRMVMIKHSNNYSTSYMHLAGFGPGVHAGGHVSQGQLIGYVGSSGLATGPHLDFRVYRGGQAIDPLKLISPPSYPVSAQNMRAFDSISALYLKNMSMVK